MEDYKEKTREQEEIQFAYNVFILFLQKIFILAFKLLRFCLYLAILFIEMFLNIIKKLFLQEYDPFKNLKKAKQDRADEQARDYIFRNTKPHAVVKHSYEFIRSRVFAKKYSEIDNLLLKCAKYGAQFNDDVYNDVMKKIDILIIEAEKQAHIEGYEYAKETKFKFDSQEEFNFYVKDKVMKGVDYREQNKKQLEEFKGTNN